MKRCVLRVRGRKVRHEVSVATLQELMEKAFQVLNLNATRASVSLVLAKDGTKVDSNDFFLCLPENTEFLALIGSKKWTCSKTDGGTMWMDQESTDDVSSLVEEQSMENYPSIILYSASGDPDACANDAKTFSPDVNGNVQNIQQLRVEDQEPQRPYCQQIPHMSLLSSIYHVAKEKLSPRLQRKKQVQEEVQ